MSKCMNTFCYHSGKGVLVAWVSNHGSLRVVNIQRLEVLEPFIAKKLPSLQTMHFKIVKCFCAVMVESIQQPINLGKA